VSKKAPIFKEEMNCKSIYLINDKYITKSMRWTNTVRIIAGKETRAKLAAIRKAFVNCWNEVEAW